MARRVPFSFRRSRPFDFESSHTLAQVGLASHKVLVTYGATLTFLVDYFKAPEVQTSLEALILGGCKITWHNAVVVTAMSDW